MVATPCTGVITYTRLYLPPSFLPAWSSSENPLSKLNFASEGKIEDAHGFLQVDFANSYIGGGVLRSGCGQEEIRFSTCPELLASMLFSEAMQDTEAIYVTGFKQFCGYSGYGDSFRFAEKVSNQMDNQMTSLVAMDARRYAEEEKEKQFNGPEVSRDLNKAFVAFRGQGRREVELPSVATGNWGCGAFGGDPKLKLLIQWMAASEAGRDLAYFTFGDEELAREGGDLISKLVEKSVTVGQLFEAVVSFDDSTEHNDGRQLFEWVWRALSENMNKIVIV